MIEISDLRFNYSGSEFVLNIDQLMVQSGETLFDVCHKFDMMPDVLRKENNIQGELTAGTTLKVNQPVPIYLDENIQRMTMNLLKLFYRTMSVGTNTNTKRREDTKC